MITNAEATARLSEIATKEELLSLVGELSVDTTGKVTILYGQTLSATRSMLRVA